MPDSWQVPDDISHTTPIDDDTVDDIYHTTPSDDDTVQDTNPAPESEPHETEATLPAEVEDCARAKAQCVEAFETFNTIVNSRRETNIRASMYTGATNIMNVLIEAAQVGPTKVTKVADAIRASDVSVFVPSLTRGGNAKTKRRKPGWEDRAGKQVRRKKSCSYCSGSHNWQTCPHKARHMTPTFVEMEQFMRAFEHVENTSPVISGMIQDGESRQLQQCALTAVPKSFSKFQPNVLFVDNVYTQNGTSFYKISCKVQNIVEIVSHQALADFNSNKRARRLLLPAALWSTRLTPFG